MALFAMPQTLGLRIATGTILGLCAFMFLLRVTGRDFSSESGPSDVYIQGKYSLGGFSMFSSWSQFFLGLLFYAPVLLLSLALLLSTFLKTKLVGDSQVLGFQATTVLLAIGSVGLGGLFIMPANASRILFSVEVAPTLRAACQSRVHVGEGGQRLRLDTKDVEDQVQIALAKYNETTKYGYVFFSLKFFGWYLFLLAYVFCMLLSFGVIHLVTPESEPEVPDAVHDIEKQVQDDIDDFMKTSDFDDTLYSPNEATQADETPLVVEKSADYFTPKPKRVSFAHLEPTEEDQEETKLPLDLETGTVEVDL